MIWSDWKKKLEDAESAYEKIFPLKNEKSEVKAPEAYFQEKFSCGNAVPFPPVPRYPLLPEIKKEDYVLAYKKIQESR